MKLFTKIITIISLSVSFLQADFKTDLININNTMIDLNSSISNVQITSEAMCAPLIALNQEAQAIIDTITLTNDSMSAPLLVDAETLVLAQNLFTNVASISAQTVFVSSEITLLAPSTDALTLGDGIRAVLQLSSDIGEMADRIGEMADNILIMSDNIGLMADGIVETQLIQSENLVLTQNNVLLAQTNTLALVSVAETSSYDLDLQTLVDDGNILITKMTFVSLDRWSMDNELEDVQADVNTYLTEVKAFQTAFNFDTDNNTSYVSTDSLDELTNLTFIMTAIGGIMDGYVMSIAVVDGITSDRTLLPAMNSLLNISADIGSASNSILEMSDVILTMADNIGLVANEIIVAQDLQSLNIAVTQASILAAQSLAISNIAARD